jgi:transcriptional regulator of acetoin/glycerol metabolism
MDRFDDGRSEKPAGESALVAVGSIFNALGRVLICLDRDFHVIWASEPLDPLAPGRTAERRSAAEIFGSPLFGPGAALREALVAGERHEGWRATLTRSDGTERLFSLTASPFPRGAGGWDRRVAYLLIARPADDDVALGSGSPILFAGLIARSAAMDQIFRLVEGLRASAAPVLLTGENGVGKEAIARAIHASSSRSRGPFAVVRCADQPADALENEIFGPGGSGGGKYDRVANGTLFLDDVDMMPAALQTELLYLLEERAHDHAAGAESARIVGGSSTDLRRAITDGRFREDLYYRLGIIPITIPPLRYRREDIEPLARYLLARIAEPKSRILRFSPEAIRMLVQYEWPGNVRELESALEHAVAVCRRQTILPEDLPFEVRAAAAAAAGGEGRELDSDEARRIRSALEASRWRREAAAEALGMSRTTLWRKMKEHGLIDS